MKCAALIDYANAAFWKVSVLTPFILNPCSRNQ
uniref:Uncharacterized protein n=1 Tax=virus sp. ctnRj46 TaxID=2826814 RepID=A0A8S5R7M3_9VIRU|nr:MAG TPA: hypothetical protein [virus sp. ctnRj46]